MRGIAAPQSECKLARHPALNKYTVWSWSMMVFSVIGSGLTVSFSGNVEADETFQQELSKGCGE